MFKILDKNTPKTTVRALLVASSLNNVNVVADLEIMFAGKGPVFTHYADIKKSFCKIYCPIINHELVDGHITEIKQVPNGHESVYLSRIYGVDLPKNAILTPVYKMRQELENGVLKKTYQGIFGFAINTVVGFMSTTTADQDVKNLVNNITRMSNV